MATTVMMNLFVLIILNDFEEYNLKDDNPVELFKENLESFRDIWAEYTKEYRGQKIREKNLVAFFMELPRPLGFGDPKKKEEAKGSGEHKRGSNLAKDLKRSAAAEEKREITR